MMTTLDIDDEALSRAMQVSPERTKADVVNDALREYARRRRVRKILQFEGMLPWEGDLDDLRVSGKHA